MRSWRWYSKVLFALLVAAFAYFGWPTPWRYFVVERGGCYSAQAWAKGGISEASWDETQTGVVLRVNRFTDRTELLFMDRWRYRLGTGKK